MDKLVNVYAMMLKIRMFEERIVALYSRQEIRTPVHLCIGQEAIAAGVCAHLGKDDLVFTNHRCHGHVLAKGVPLGPLVAELYGKATGCCRGKGGSMHLCDPSRGIPATSAIVGGGIALAVGAALSLRLQDRRDIAVAFFGDGAADEGVFYESLNFAALKKLPVLFVCENNFYATNSPLRARQPLDNIYKRASLFGIPGARCDGNDARRVWGVCGRAVESVRQGRGPRLVECRTYRWKGHVGPDCDAQKGCRPVYEVDSWQKKCPVKRMERFLSRRGALSAAAAGDLRAQIEKELDDAWRFASQSPMPAAEELREDVFLEKRPCPGQK